MELKEFVSQSLIQIMEGVRDAQEKAKEFNARVNPFTDVRTDAFAIEYTFKDTQHVEFEVCVTSEDKKGAAGGLSVLFGAISVSGKVEDTASKIALNRLKFSVPVIYPMYHISEETPCRS